MDLQRERKTKSDEVLKKKSDLLAKVRISLRQLQQMAKILKVEGMPVEWSPGFGEEDLVVKPEEDEIDGLDCSFLFIICFIHQKTKQ